MTSPSPQLPPRPTEIHDSPCVHCPSEHFAIDPEAEDLLNACARGDISQSDFLFTCAWRGEKICRGLWNRLQERLLPKT